MTNTNIVNQILATANEAYENGECRINEDLPKGERGDTLADFLAIELQEVTEGEPSATAAISSAYAAVDSAIRQLTDVRDSLDNLALNHAS
ncbi:MAG: hypothetical protein AWU57_599 [Marinobacter sp. T13-3]|nr:MAG: hypothetical protein AWU57_599 [Marinobacter sp. T13-3]